MAMSKIAIVVALEREIRPLVKHSRREDKEQDGRSFRFFVHENAVLVCGGIGSQSARRAAEAVINLYEPVMIYSAGYAGALNPEWKVGRVFYPERVINAGDGSSVSIADGAGVLVSYDHVASPQQKLKLRESYSAQAVDMEAAAVARAAEARGIEFRALKVISDESDFALPPMNLFVDSDGRFREARFALFTMLRPWLWPKVVRLAQNSRQATRVLCEELRNVTRNKIPSADLEGAQRR